MMNETCEKLFTAHLRLPSLTRSEIRDLIRAYSGQRADDDREKLPLEEHRSELHYRANMPGTDKQAESDRENAQAELDEIDEQLRVLNRDTGELSFRKPTRSVEKLSRALSDDEVGILLKALDGSEHLRENLGPRAIRAFIFRYQLARLLLDQLQLVWDVRRVVNGLASRSLAVHTHTVARPVTTELSNGEKVERIIEQVS
jgi:DNA repair exonuclease SbcCD ATPase subunit